MHGLGPQLGEIDAIAASVHATPPPAEVLICVPATLLSRAVQTAAGRIAVGGEDCHAEVAGAFTGDVSADMLKDAGATAVIVGHSERRRYHHETDAMVAAKAKAAWQSGLSTIICVGETQEQRRADNALTVCSDQIAGSLPEGAAQSCPMAIAYEPLWAIGSGHMPIPDEITEVHLHIRSCLAARLGTVGKHGPHPPRRLHNVGQRPGHPWAARGGRRADRWGEPEGNRVRRSSPGRSGAGIANPDGAMLLARHSRFSIEGGPARPLENG